MLAKSGLQASLALIMLAATAAQAAPATPNYALAETTPLSGPVRWDFLAYDTVRQRVFMTRDNRVDVFDAKSKKTIASIGGLEKTHGVVIVSGLNKGFISEGAANRITVFDLTTLAPMTTVATGIKPDAMLYEPISKSIYVADADSDDFTVIDADTNKVRGTVKLDGAPESAVTDGQGRIYVNLEDKSAIDVVDTKTLKLVGTYDISTQCKAPTGLAIDLKSNVLFATCANKHMVVVDATNGKIKSTLDIGAHSDGAGYDPGTGWAFSSNGDGTLTVVGKDGNGEYKVLQTVPTKVTARTMTLDPDTHDIYLSAADTEGVDPPTEAHPEPRPHVKLDSFALLRVSLQH